MSPVVAVAIAAPFTVGAMAQGSDQVFLAVPTVVGCVSAPGYLYALLGWPFIPGLSAGRRWWIRFSLLGVISAAAVGAVFSLVLILPSIASIATAVNAVVAWRRLEEPAKASPAVM